MSLWTPYCQEAALDLRVAATVKDERISPVPSGLYSGHHNIMSYTYPQSAPTVQDRLFFERQPVGMYYSYTQGPNYTAPLNQISPESNRSYHSEGYDSTASHTSLSYQSQPNAPSPPETPDPLKECRTNESSENKLILDLEPISDDPEYQAFERDALRAMATKNGGSLLGNNPRMRRAVRPTNPNPTDGSYREQRERNNLAAKQSRDRRKLREVRLALEVTYLSKKVAKLRAQLAAGVCERCRV